MTVCLSGSWTFQRQIVSRLENSPSGQVDGTATFITIIPATPVPPYTTISSVPLEPENQETNYLYSELGTMALADSKQQSFEVRNNYIWVHNPIEDKLNVYFEENGSRAHLFNTLRFLPDNSPEIIENMPNELIQLTGLKAISDHLCGNDNYKSAYLFQVDGNNKISRMDIVYNVLGPKKDYTSSTTYFPNLHCSSSIS